MRSHTRRQVGSGSLELRAEGEFTLPPGTWGGGPARRLIALRAKDASLRDDGIREGDYLLVEPYKPAEAGNTVVIEVEGVVTVGRLSCDSRGRVAVVPAGSGRLPLEPSPLPTRIIGPVVGVLRRQGFRTTGRSAPRRTVSLARRPELSLPGLGTVLDSAARGAAERPGPAGAHLRELVQSLRGLRDCYLATTTPRLKEALLREALELVGRLRRFDVEPFATSA
jgi:hypothetical protein